MAKFDVHRGHGGNYWLDCQADIWSDLNSRFVVPLRLATEGISTNRRLNPHVSVGGEPYEMLTHFAAAVPVAALGPVVASLVDQEFAIGAALDMLISGY
jgi:toxin CcdB